MTLVADPRADDRTTPPSRRRFGPLWAHLVALAVVLVVLVPVIGTSASFSADEGAAIVQAKSLAAGHGWLVAHPVPQVDPTGAAYPLELSGRGSNGTAPFVKHPAYAVLLAAADRLGGVAAMVLLSMLGAVAAAGLAALLARRLDPVLAVPTLWVVGLGSPLLFDGYLVIAHTLGAACAAGAVLAAAVAVERRSRWAAAAVLPCMAGAVLMRTEAAFLGLGLAVAAVTLLRRHDRVVVGMVAAASVAGVLGARMVERVWIGSVLGGPGVGTGPLTPIASQGWIRDRWQAFVLTWLRPSYSAPRIVDLCLVLMAAALVLAAYNVRRGRPGGVGPCAVVAGAAALVALAVAPDNLVPGLLMACPLIGAGLALVGRDTLASPTARLAAVTSAVFVAAVLATQYATGGSGEWGGRYFALALPVALPVLVLALRRRGSQPLVAGLLVCAVVMSVMAVSGIRSTHRFTAGLVAAVDRASGPDRPVLVTTQALVPRLSWPTMDHQRWLLSKPADLGSLVDRFAPAGITRFTFVARGGADVALLPPGLVREASTTYHGWQILVLGTS